MKRQDTQNSQNKHFLKKPEFSTKLQYARLCSTNIEYRSMG